MILNLETAGIPKLDKRLQEMAVKSGTNVRFVCMDQMRLWCRDCMIRIAGEAGAGGPATNKLLSLHRKAGMEAVETDLNKVFDVIQPRESRFEGTDYLVWPEGDKTKKPFRVQPILNLKKHHNSQRTTRKRKVPKDGYETEWVTKENFIKYRKYVRNRVGIVKAGFATPYTIFSRKTNSIARIPKWIAQNMGENGGGRAVYSTMSKEGEGKIIGENRVSYASSALKPSTFRATERTRARDMIKQADRRLEQLAKRFRDGQP